MRGRERESSIILEHFNPKGFVFIVSFALLVKGGHGEALE